MTASTNVMSVGPQPSGGTKAVNGGSRQSLRTGGSTRTDAQKNGKFGKVLDQTQDNGKISAQDAAAQADSVTDIPKDPIAAAIAASSQQTQEESSGSAAAEAEASTQVQASVPMDGRQGADSHRTAVSLLQNVSETMQVPEDEAEEFLRNTGNSKGDFAENQGLQMLLPQSKEDSAKGKSMLHMLSGQNWRSTEMQASAQTLNQGPVKEVPAELMNGKTVGTTQDVPGVWNPQTSQDMMQQGRPQAQPGMQGMPMMQDAQAPLTRPAQTEVEPQTAVMSEEQKPSMGLQQGDGEKNAKLPMMQDLRTAGSAEVLKSQMKATEEPQQSPDRLRDNPGPEQHLSRPLIRHDDSRGYTEPGQEIPAGSEAKAVSPEPDKTGISDRVVKQPEPMKEILQKPEAVQQAAAATTESGKKTRQDMSELLGTQVAAVSSDDRQTVPSVREMMHGQQQSGEDRQQPQERQQTQPMMQGIPTASDETTEEGIPVQNSSLQNAADTPAQSHQTGGFHQVMSSAQPHVSESAQTPMAARQDYNVPAQIVEQARLIRSAENTEMVIHLKPEHLGDLTLKVSVTGNGSVTASFHSDNAQVRAIIENSLVQLRQELSNQGIKVDNVEVYAGLSGDSLMNGQGQQAWQQNQQGNSSRNRNLDFDSYEEEGTEASAASADAGTEEGVDYRV